MDIDARKQAQELQAVLNQQFSHRLKNQVALVQSIVTQFLRKATDLSTARYTIVQGWAYLLKHTILLCPVCPKGLSCEISLRELFIFMMTAMLVD